MRMRPFVLTAAVALAAFALGGCEDDDELTDGGTLILDDDRTEGDVLTVYLKLGSETATTVQLGFGVSKTVTLAQGSYTVTFDDDGVEGPTTGDTVESAVLVETGKTTTVEYAGEDDSDVIGPVPQANG
jgi:hypothetical protein